MPPLLVVLLVTLAASEVGWWCASARCGRRLRAVERALASLQAACAHEYENGLRHGRSALWAEITAVLNAHDRDALDTVQYLKRRGKIAV